MREFKYQGKRNQSFLSYGFFLKKEGNTDVGKPDRLEENNPNKHDKIAIFTAMKKKRAARFTYMRFFF